MKKKPNRNVPAVTWVTLPPESSTRTSLKSVDEYLSEIQDDVPQPQRRLCLSPETLKVLENAERIVENAERQLSKMNFNSLIIEELESEKFNGKASEEDKIYIRNVVASTLKKGFYDPGSSVALAEHMKPKFSTFESCRPISPSKISRFLQIPKEPLMNPKESELGCLVCSSAVQRPSKECRRLEQAPQSIPKPTDDKVDNEEPPERLTVHRAPNVNIKAELAMRTVTFVDIQPQESVSNMESRENVAVFEVRHESVRLGSEKPAVVKVAKPPVHRVHKHKTHSEKLRYLTSPKEKHRKHRQRREKVTIEDITVGELSLAEPQILADIDSLLGRQRDVMHQLNRFDKFFASKLPSELPSSSELEPPEQIYTPLAAATNKDNEKHSSWRTNSQSRKSKELEQKSRQTVETTQSNEDDGSSMVSSEEVEIAKVDYTDSFESASSVAETRSDVGFVEDLQEANLYAGASDESQETDVGTASQVTSDVNVEVNVEVEVDDESVEEDKDGSATEKLQGSSQKTSHLIDSIPDISSGKASESSNNSLKPSTVSGIQSTESKIESRITKVRGNLDSLLKSIDSSERSNDASVKMSDKAPKASDVSAENQGDLDRNYNGRSKGLSQAERSNEVIDKNIETDDLINELSKQTRNSENSASKSSQNNSVNKNSHSKSIDSENDPMMRFPPLDGDTGKISMRDSNTNLRERDEVKLKSRSAALDDISELLEASLEIDVVDKTVSDEINQSKILIDERDQINNNNSTNKNNNAVGKNNRSNESVDRSGPGENLIAGSARRKSSPAVDEISTVKFLNPKFKNDFVAMKVNNHNGQDEEHLCPKRISKSFETQNRWDLIDSNDHRQDKVHKKQPIILDEINVIGREHNLSNTRSLITLLEENSEEVRDSFQQQKLTWLKILESCSIPSSYQGKRVFTSTVLEDLEPPSGFARLKESSQSESSSDTYSEGEVRFSSSTSHSMGEIRRKNEFSKSSSLTKTTSSGSYNPTISLSRSAGELSEIAVDSLR